MARHLRRLLPQLHDHVTDERLASLLCDELTWWERLLTRRHLATCQLCSVRRQNFEARFEEVFARFQQGLKRKNPPLPSDDTDEFLQRVDLWLASYVPKRRWSFRCPMITLPELPSMNPTLATGLVLILAAVVCLFAWNQQRVPKISSNALLVKAERWDTAQMQNTGSVIYQSVRIVAPQQTVQRKIYRDPKGNRHLKPVALAADDAELKKELTTAGVDWDEPLSATSYQQWHDSQHVREDEVTRVGRNLLKLTTTAAQGPIEEQSLLVREMDFHPIKRTIAFRDRGTVEVAELEFKILPWSSVDASVFEPVAATAGASSAEVIPFRLPSVVSAAQLDEAELTARLALNHLRADAGERIEVVRESQAIAVKGVVDSDARKQQLLAQLKMLPHVQPSIHSIQELERHPADANAETGKTEVFSATTQPSPLANYFIEKGRSTKSLSNFSQQLIDSATTVKAESQTIADLMTRFGSAENATDLAKAALSELVFSHRERLLIALDTEKELLGSSGIAMASRTSAPALVNNTTLVVAAERNLALCNELTVGGGSVSRDAASILSELSASAEEVRSRLRQTRLAAQTGTASNVRK